MEEKTVTNENMTIEQDVAVPDGMLLTVAGRLVQDDGHGRLLELMDAAYEQTDRVCVSIVGRAPYELFLGDHVQSDGALRLAQDIDVLVGGTVRHSHDGDGLVEWRGGHLLGSRRTERFRIDGRAAKIEYEDVMSSLPSYEK